MATNDCLPSHPTNDGGAIDSCCSLICHTDEGNTIEQLTVALPSFDRCPGRQLLVAVSWTLAPWLG